MRKGTLPKRKVQFVIVLPTKTKPDLEMIIPILGATAELVIYSKEILELELPKDCKICEENSLVSHGYYVRGYIDDVEKHYVQVARLRCRRCRLTFSCLYEFLIPYRRYSVDLLAKGIFTYLTVLCSYAEALWEATESEIPVVISTMWRVMDSFLRKIHRAQIELQRGLVAGGVDLLGTGMGFFDLCCNSVKARVEGKALLLIRAASVALMAERLLQGDAIRTMHRYFLSTKENNFYILAGRKGIKLSGPHSVQMPIF